MNKIFAFAWACLYILCVGLGIIQGATGVLKVALVIVSLIFFVPGALLLYDGLSKNNRKLVLWIRRICLISLGLTTAGLVAFLLCAAYGTGAAVDVAFDLLMLVSAPMTCSQYWILSLFLWACLLSATFFKKDRR